MFGDLFKKPWFTRSDTVQGKIRKTSVPGAFGKTKQSRRAWQHCRMMRRRMGIKV